MPHISDPLLQAYVDGYCNVNRAAEIESHVETCAECRERLESARNAAQRATQLLGVLDPGPVHAPAFEELQARAAQRSAAEEIEAPPVDLAGGDEIDAAPAEEADWASVMAAQKTPKKAQVAFWRRPALAWAATLVMAFGLGWISRNELGLPADLQAPAGPTFERLNAPASAMAPTEAIEAQLQEEVAAGELDDATAAKRAGSLEVPAEPEPTLPTAAEAPELRQQGQQMAQNRAAAGLESGRRDAEPQPMPAAPARTLTLAPAVFEDEAQVEEMNEMVAVGGTFGDAASAAVAPAEGFFVVDRDEAERWLGVAPREIPDLALLRIEVGPGDAVANGVRGRPAVRLVYLSRNGVEIALTQQYSGSLEGAGQVPASQLPVDRLAGSDAVVRAERAREASELRADTRKTADRDAAVGGLVGDRPATVRDPDGRVTYRWADDDGYLLSLSGVVDPDIIRGLVELIR